MALDKCSNAEPGTYGHECEAPATWIASRPATSYDNTGRGIYETGFCTRCKETGYERHGFTFTPVEA